MEEAERLKPKFINLEGRSGQTLREKCSLDATPEGVERMVLKYEQENLRVRLILTHSWQKMTAAKTRNENA
jgi:hypothetical protein